jgi:hypothetical protein
MIDSTLKSKPLLRHKNKQYNQIDIEEQAFVYDLMTGSILTPEFQPINRVVNAMEELPVMDEENEYHYENNSPWKELERVVFLKYVMAFGFNYPSSDMFNRLLIFSKGVFQDSDHSEFNIYSKHFLSALNNYSKSTIQTPFHRYYFFDLEVHRTIYRPTSYIRE